MFDVLIIGAGAAGMSCALVLGSAKDRSYVKSKRIAIITHQKTSHLQTALLNNVLGVSPGTTGASILKSGKKQLNNLYPHISQIKNEKASNINNLENCFEVTTNKNSYKSKIVVIAVGYTDLISINGLENYIEAHPRTDKDKNKIWLKNVDHLITKNLYVVGTLAGWRSQFAIASGSGAHVATDILTLWNDGKHTKVHDKISS
ncbi:FAD-dependent oxidoreductase [Pontimicrobium aquaticum]|uniref:NAD(P)/FAD-dependent oxidoreductase n=1 Tax=Pontimicrobium aquaticum TaxID=2565367 RepID=A0A4U0ETU3_9FLAO|nr:FAD-dependent oxidoreductase [Pontimicrobium aquaticum]TJY34644.1 NAD(P)/FAD-dependent oxidoreductase [Pontimicrobium aquaticum]